jgi:rubrerythrin
MFSTDPPIIMRKEKMDKEDMIRAVRGALAAEIDAINYYLQQGKLFSDEFVKKVHDDIAKEEMTHFGEFLRLLYHLNKEEFDYIVKGLNEASKLIGENVEFPIKENYQHYSRKGYSISNPIFKKRS